MKKTVLVVAFIAAHVLFIFLQIHKHSAFIKASYRKQKNELIKESLTQKISDQSQQLQILKTRSRVQEFAYAKLNMQPISLRQIKRVSVDEQNT